MKISFSGDQKIEIVKRYEVEGLTQRELGEEYGCSASRIGVVTREMNRYDGREVKGGFVGRKGRHILINPIITDDN